MPSKIGSIMLFHKKHFLFVLIVSINSLLWAQNRGDDVVGYYLTIDPFSGAMSQVYLYNAGNDTYEGKIIWVEVEEGKKYEGYVFLKKMIFNTKDNEWQNGSIVYPGKSGKFKTYMRFEKDGRLRVRGYWGVSLLGKTVYWTREKESRKEK